MAFFRQFKFFIAPVMLIIAGFDTISFGFYVALNALTPVWLQKPKQFGGIYGFTVGENAACKPNRNPPMMAKLMHTSHICPLVWISFRPHLRPPRQRSPPTASRPTTQPNLEARISLTRPLADKPSPDAIGPSPRRHSTGI